MRNLKTSEDSKKIKKGGSFGKKHEITDHSVRMKLKQHRLVVPTHKLK